MAFTTSYHIHKILITRSRGLSLLLYLWQVSLVKKMDGTDWFIIWLVRDGEKKQQKKLNIHSRSWIDILNEIQMKEEKKKLFNYTIVWSTFEIYYNFPSLQRMIGSFCENKNNQRSLKLNSFCWIQLFRKKT